MSTPHPRALDVDTLWQIERLGAPALSPDGQRAVITVTTPSMLDNRSSTRLWLLHTGQGAPRRLTFGAKDGQPQWSPRGDRIAFVAKREQEGSKDESAQLYLIAPDGGEAARASHFGPGVESFKWLPDGRRIVFAAWVWPELKGAAAQNKRQKVWDARKETGYATSEAFYRHWDDHIPQGRALHLLLLDTRNGRVTDLFEGQRYELPRDNDGNAVYDISPDGRRIAFAHDPATEPRAGNRLALAEIDLRSGRIRSLVSDAAWDVGAPRYSPDGVRLAFVAANVGLKHTADSRAAVLEADGNWRTLTADWDHSVNAPLRWTADGAALLFSAEDRGRCPLWRCDVASGAVERVFDSGWVQGFDAAAGTVAVAADAARHPAQIHAWQGAGAPRRLERFNDDLLTRVDLGELREVSITGALGQPVQMWLTLPPGFNPRKKHAVVHVIHGGPYAAAGDTFGYRWNPHIFAAPGRVIAQVNFHGSSGFGQAFKDSLIGRQGELELQDIEAATDWLLTQPWADAKRVFATGGSYGGFLVAWMNGHVPAWPKGRYRAYICHAGVFDRVATFSADSYPVRPKDLGANYWDDMDRVLAQSPHASAGRMNTPTLVIHGAKDFRVPDCNGLAYYNTLKARGVEARLLWFADENHWVLKPRTSKLWYAEFQAWLAQHSAVLKAQAPRKSGRPL